MGLPQKSLRYFDPTAFILPPVGIVGNLASRSMRSPGVATVDIGLHKQIPFREAVSLQFRMEAFNLFNRANFKFPSCTNLYTSQGAIQPSAGVITETSTTSRQLQASLKFVF